MTICRDRTLPCGSPQAIAAGLSRRLREMQRNRLGATSPPSLWSRTAALPIARLVSPPKVRKRKSSRPVGGDRQGCATPCFPVAGRSSSSRKCCRRGYCTYGEEKRIARMVVSDCDRSPRDGVWCVFTRTGLVHADDVGRRRSRSRRTHHSVQGNAESAEAIASDRAVFCAMTNPNAAKRSGLI